MDNDDSLSLAYKYAPYPLLAAIVGFMAWVRTMPYDEMVTESGVYFSGNDPWYHMRIVRLVVANFPATPDFDPWSYFPYGTGRHSGFGGLFDQIIALFAIIAGGGDPSTRTIETVGALAPVAFGALTAVIVFFIVKRIADRWTAVFSAFVLALFTGQFLNRTMVGNPDHQSAEAFFGSLALLGFIYGIQTAYTEKPTVAHLKDSDWKGLKTPIVASVLGGIAVASYLMTWPPGVMVVFAFGIFVLLQASRDHYDGVSTEYLAFGTAATLGVTAVLTLLYAKTYALEGTGFSLLQPLTAVGVAVGAVVLHYLSEYMRDEYDPEYYPAVVIGGAVLGSILLWFTVPQFQSLINRVYSFGLLTSASGLTVAEIQPASIQDAWRSFGAMFFVGLAGLAVVLFRSLSDRNPGELIVFVFGFTMFSAYFTSIRFGYYMAVTVAVLSGFFVWWLVKQIGIEHDTDLSDIKGYQAIAIVLVLVLVIPGNVLAVAGTSPAWSQAPRLAGYDGAWDDELSWMQNNTPEEPLSYDRYYDKPQDGDFDYPEEAYGVQSWWDYGHWITYQAERIPNANPFQEGPNPASAYLTAQSEERANLVLDSLPSADDEEIDWGNVSNDRLRSVAESQNEQERQERNTRYVMIDDQMAAGKFGAIATWTQFDEYTSRQSFQQSQGNQTLNLPATNSKYENTTLSRLYFDDANGMSHYRLVHETQQYSLIGNILRQGLQQGQQGQITAFNRIINRGNASRFANTDTRNQLIPAGGSSFVYDAKGVARVKTYEKVEGAEFSGSVSMENVSNATITAILNLQTTNTGRNFTYSQDVSVDDDGDFTMTVPYPTENDVSVSEGGTDEGVRATGNYTLYKGGAYVPTFGTVLGASSVGNAEVPESAVYDGETIEVEMEEVQQNQGNQTQTQTQANTTSTATNSTSTATNTTSNGNTR
ncbi:oligosaccharyl transferase, archaeosortase A system-associated [Halorutilales archaeon Cl-col2-1]